MLCIEVSCDKTKFILDHHIFIDKLSIIMVLIIAIVGGDPYVFMQYLIWRIFID